jgi:hypothetical protein
MPEDYEQLRSIFESRNAPVPVRLFRAKSAPLILYFLRREFKLINKSIVLHHDLLRRLTDLIEQLNFQDYADDYDRQLEKIFDSQEKASLLIRKWSDAGYLTYEQDDKGGYFHSLTSDTEKVLEWLESLRKDDFKSTESKFKDIFFKLSEINEGSTENWKEKVESLKTKKREIESQIRQLEIDQKVVSEEDYYVKSRFNEVSRLARSLLADFREVEENFNSIKNSIYEKQTNLELSKGNILNYTLDALDDLRNTDQGKSFEAFYRHLLDDSSKDELTELIRKVMSIMQKRNIEVEDTFLLHLRIYVNREGGRVRDSYHKLADKLNKVLAEKSLLDRKNAIRLVNDIKANALKAIDNPPSEDNFIEIDGYPDIEMTMERPLADEPQDISIRSKVLKTADIDLTQLDLDNLVAQFFIDREKLEMQVREMLKNKNQVTLKDVISNFPVSRGLSEVLTYINIATQSSRSFINKQKMELIVIDDKGKKAIQLPEIIFTK